MYRLVEETVGQEKYEFGDDRNGNFETSATMGRSIQKRILGTLKYMILYLLQYSILHGNHGGR